MELRLRCGPELSRKAQKTEISGKTGRFKKKKRFGKSIANKAPAMLIAILQQKCISLGLPGVIKVPTSARASQYNHQTQEYMAKPLSQRWNHMPDGKNIQRDIYSAFLLQHYDQELKRFDQVSLERDYSGFVKEHERVIKELSKKLKMFSSMGVRRSIS